MLNEIRKLGDGLQGHVSLCVDETGCFALKQYKNRASFAREYEVLSRLGGLKNVMQLRSTKVEVGDMRLSLQLCSNGELFNFMEHCGFLEEALAKSIFFQILNEFGKRTIGELPTSTSSRRTFLLMMIII
jgi:serine/threonine protein kinase